MRLPAPTTFTPHGPPAPEPPSRHRADHRANPWYRIRADNPHGWGPTQPAPYSRAWSPITPESLIAQLADIILEPLAPEHPRTVGWNGRR